MSDETRTEDMRFELGREAAQRGEPLHETASEEFRRGYSHGGVGFGSNVTPRKFGIGRSQRQDWKCICGEVNRRYRNQCDKCGVRREVALVAQEN